MIEGGSRKIAEEFFLTTIAPELKIQLMANKDAILKSAFDSSVKIADAITKAMTEDAIKNISQSWNRTKLYDAIFK